MYLLRHVALVCLGLFAVFAQAEDRGTIFSEYWLGIPGNALTGLTTDARYPASPSGVSVLTSFQTPVNTADSYGTRVRGYLYPPVTGAYRFWVAGDDQCELWLSTDDSPATKVLIANTYSWTSPQEWTKYASQQSVEITLQAGSRYYIEALHKEGGGGDSLAVAWAYPGVDRQVIPGEFLAPAAPAPVPGSGTGYVLREWWSGLTGTAVADLTAAPAFPASPTARDYLTTFETPANWGDNYGTRVRGFLRPTQSGTYFFWVSGDDGCQLWLSQDAQPSQKGLIASVPGHTATREWTKYPQQKSIAIDLQAGASYYIEALHKEGGGGDIVSVAWSGPGIGDTPTVITGNYLSPSSTENAPAPVGQGSGTILVETWNDIPGNNLAALTAHPSFPARPTARGVLTQFKSPADYANTYGRRIRGYVCPAITGNYRFWIASDDEGSLRLSTNENPADAVAIAGVTTWTGVEQWDQFPEQQSALIPLTGGQRYYIEAMQKEGNGGDHLAVAWVGPSLVRGVIPGAYLAPVIAPIIEGTLEFTTSTTVTISATGTGGWLRYTTDGTTPTAASTHYTAPFEVTASTVVKAIHVDGNGIAGEVAEQVFLRQGTGTGLAGSYFANEYLGGQPVLRLDPALQFIWGTTAPMSGIPADHFSVRWQGEIETQLNEEYTLILRSDDGVRVWLDGALVINDWTYHGATDRTCVLPSGRHTIAIEYMEGAVQAELQMFWQSAHQTRTIVPSSQLYPLEGVQGIIPPTSPVSPAYVEVVHGSGASIDATVAGNAFPTNHLDDTIRYFNVPLDPAQPTAVALSSGSGASLTSDITWTPTNVVGNTEMVIRKNDSLLLQFPQTGSLLITNYSGTFLGPITVSAGQRLPVLFSKAGEFTVRLNSQGVEVATLEVTVVTADLTHTILCEVGFTRGIGIDINPFDAPLTFVGNSQLLVTTEAIAQDLASLHITPLRRGTPRLQARIHGAHGPLVAEQVIDEFTIDNAALHSAAVNAQTGIGTVTLVMRPYIPKQIFTMTMFAHTATFKGGATSLTINSTGGSSTNGEPPMIQKFNTATNETIGIFRFDLEIPENESKYCFRVARIQEEEEAEGGAYLPNSGSIFGVQASLSPAALSLLLGSHTGGGDGPTTNVNGDVCHILAYASVIFTKAVDSSEDEINESSNSEQWSSRTWSLVTADYCEKGKKGDGNCNAVSYKLKVSDPPSFGGQLDNQLAALFGGSNKESDCKTCTGSCGAVTPAMDSGTIPGKYTTSVEVCSTGDNDTTGDAVGGVFYVSKLDAYGANAPAATPGNDTTKQFPKYAVALRKRTGSVYQPVIQMISGGDGAVNGCSLYGWSGEPYCVPKNKWSFKAIARDMEDSSVNIPASKGFSIKWKNVPGHDNRSEETLTDVSFPVGRHMPRLEVWFTDPETPGAVPELVGAAEIHSLVVEPYPAANAAEKGIDVPENQRLGMPFVVQNNAGGQTVDARLKVVGHDISGSSGKVRGRVSLDGYPQNEYWVTAGDSDDLPQVVGVKDGDPQKYYLQGYDVASTSEKDVTLVVEGQALLENCSDCSPFLLTTVSATWQETDTEKFTTLAVGWTDLANNAVIDPQQASSESDEDADPFDHNEGEAGGPGGFGGPPVGAGFAKLADPFVLEAVQFTGNSPARTMSAVIRSNVSTYVQTVTLTELNPGTFADTADTLAIQVQVGPTADGGVQEIIQARVTSSAFRSKRSMLLHETGANTNLFASRRIQIVMNIGAPLVFDAINEVSVLLSDGSTQIGPLTVRQDAIGSMSFASVGNEISLVVQDGILVPTTLPRSAESPSPAVAKSLKASVTCAALGVDGMIVDAIETAAGSNMLRTDALFNHGEPGNPGGLQALGQSYAVILGDEIRNSDGVLLRWIPRDRGDGFAGFEVKRGKQLFSQYYDDKAGGTSVVKQTDGRLKFVAGKLCLDGVPCLLKLTAPAPQDPPAPPPAPALVLPAAGGDNTVELTNVQAGDFVGVFLLDDKFNGLWDAYDFVRVYDIELTDTHATPVATIPRNGYCYIENGVMPGLRAKFVPTIPGYRMTWHLNIRYNRNNRRDNDDYPAISPETPGGQRTTSVGAVWDILPDLGNHTSIDGSSVPVVRGGEARITFIIPNIINPSTFDFRIRAHNPTNAQLEAYCATQPWYIRGIIYSENTADAGPSQFNRQGVFDQGAADVRWTPYASVHDDAGVFGYGYGQLTNITGGLPNAQQLWSYQENLRTVADEMRRHVITYTTYMAGQRGAAGGIPVPNHVVSGVFFSEGTANPIDIACAIKRYNGASNGQYCQFSLGSWRFNTTNNRGINYVERVCSRSTQGPPVPAPTP